MKKSPGGLLVKDKSVGQHCSQDTSEVTGVCPNKIPKLRKSFLRKYFL